jgi:hypothetical protein
MLVVILVSTLEHFQLDRLSTSELILVLELLVKVVMVAM